MKNSDYSEIIMLLLFAVFGALVTINSSYWELVIDDGYFSFGRSSKYYYLIEAPVMSLCKYIFIFILFSGYLVSQYPKLSPKNSFKFIIRLYFIEFIGGFLLFGTIVQEVYALGWVVKPIYYSVYFAQSAYLTSCLQKYENHSFIVTLFISLIAIVMFGTMFDFTYAYIARSMG